MRTYGKRGLRAVGAGQMFTGIVTIRRAPRIATEPALGMPATTITQVVRVLGARQAVQGLALVIKPEATLGRLTALIDVLHGLSMVPIALRSGPYTQPARRSAALAVASATSAALAAGNC